MIAAREDLFGFFNLTEMNIKSTSTTTTTNPMNEFFKKYDEGKSYSLKNKDHL